MTGERGRARDLRKGKIDGWREREAGECINCPHTLLHSHTDCACSRRREMLLADLPPSLSDNKFLSHSRASAFVSLFSLLSFSLSHFLASHADSFSVRALSSEFANAVRRVSEREPARSEEESDGGMTVWRRRVDTRASLPLFSLSRRARNNDRERERECSQGRKTGFCNLRLREFFRSSKVLLLRLLFFLFSLLLLSFFSSFQESHFDHTSRLWNPASLESSLLLSR